MQNHIFTDIMGLQDRTAGNTAPPKESFGIPDLQSAIGVNWMQFEKTGSVVDYLTYTACTKEL